MRAFEVYLNGKKLCTAGVGNEGVLSAIVTWVAEKRGEELGMTVGGLVSPSDEHVSWLQKRLRVGDRIQIKVVERSATDKPAERHRRNSAELLKRERSYVRAKAKALGWKISIPR